MKAWEVRVGSTGVDGLVRTERPDPKPGPGQVLVRVRAASLNFRDLAIVTGKYIAGPVTRNTIPLSDGAGEIVAVGDGVTGFDIADRVVATFTQGRMALGSPLDGMLTELIALDQDGVLPIPANLTLAEAATLPCAGVTAWNALTEGKRVRPGDTVLTLGTGGVSMFVLQIAKAAGARVIITSSSDEKLERARALGADETINYVSHGRWEQQVLELTGGQGADLVVDLGGAGTLPHSYEAVAPAGEISLIGVMTVPDGNLAPYPLMLKGATLRGIFVGGKTLFEGLNKAIAVNDIHPVIDRSFGFDDAPEAYQYLRAAKHMGKVVIEVE